VGDVRVGISGWRYARWRGDFYPAGLRQRDELAYAAARLGTIELNGSFYSLQRPSSYAAWRDAVPPGRPIAVKGGRYITHMKKLRDVDAALANFFASGVLALRESMGPVLWQLPETLAFDADRMAGFFDQLPRTTQEAAVLARRHDTKLSGDRVLTETDLDLPVRHVLEFRHRSFCEPEVWELLRRHDVGCVVADTAGRWPEADVVTSDVVYVRLHGDTELYASGYSTEALERWAERCLAWSAHRDVFVYFDNDARGRAPWDALTLQSLVSQSDAAEVTSSVSSPSTGL
jgi:uncharacterized protein YecE (DUF72 family)